MVLPSLGLRDQRRDLSGHWGGDWPHRASQSSARDCADGPREHFRVWCNLSCRKNQESAFSWCRRWIRVPISGFEVGGVCLIEEVTGLPKSSWGLRDLSMTPEGAISGTATGPCYLNKSGPCLQPDCGHSVSTEMPCMAPIGLGAWGVMPTSARPA